MAILNLIGHRSGRLLVVGTATKYGRRGWLCKCDCGNEGVFSTSHLRRATPASCGCRRREKVANLKRTHGLNNTAAYTSWLNMKSRCLNPKHPNYPDYGGRGINVCERWRNDFAAFFADMGERPADLTLERNDVNGNYEPSNCRWATRLDQVLNRRCMTRAELEAVQAADAQDGRAA